MNENPYESPTAEPESADSGALVLHRIVYWSAGVAFLLSVIADVVFKWLYFRQKSTQYIYGPYVDIMDTVLITVTILSVLALVACRWLDNQSAKPNQQP